MAALELAGYRTAILTRVRDNYTSTPIAWPGQSFESADDVDFFTRIDVMFLDVDLISVSIERVTGFLAASIYARMGRGTDEITAFADIFRALFPNNLTVAVSGRNIRFFTPKVVPVIYEVDGIWCHQPIICNFWLDTE